jgi:DNA-binding MarR family transcriptional regulator
MQQMQNAPDEPTPEPTGSPSAEDLAALALETAPLIMRTIRRLRRDDREADLSIPQFRALGYVGRHPGTPLSAVAEHLGLSTPATSRLVDTLVERGLVVRAIAPEDRRYVTLRLTARGEATQADARARALQGLGAILADLGPDERTLIAGALPLLRQLFAQEKLPGD